MFIITLLLKFYDKFVPSLENKISIYDKLKVCEIIFKDELKLSKHWQQDGHRCTIE